MTGITPELQRKLQTALREAAVDKVKFAKLFFGYDLTERQQEAVSLGGKVSIKCAGRRFGKSTASNIDLVHACITKPRSIAYVVGPSVDQASIYFDEIERAAGVSPLLESFIEGEITRRPFPQIKFKNGSEIHGRSTAYDGKYLRGKGADIVAVTEAAFVKDTVYNEVIRALVLDRNGRILLESTPNGHNYFYNLFRQGQEDQSGYYKSFAATVYDNTRLNRDEIERIKLEIPSLAFRIEYMAEFVDDDTFVFPWHILEAVFTDYRSLTDEDEEWREGFRNPSHRYVIGVDLAKLRDYTVVTVLDCGEIGKKQKMRIVEWVQLKNVGYQDVIIPAINRLQAKYSGDGRPCKVYMDTTGVGVAIEEQIVEVVPYTFTQKTRDDLISRLTTTVEQQNIELPHGDVFGQPCGKVLFTEMRYFQRQRHGQSIRAEASAGQHDDAVFSLALAVWGGTQNKAGVFEFYRDKLNQMRGANAPVNAVQPDRDVIESV